MYFMLFCATCLNAQKVTLNYDAAGNQIKRAIVLVVAKGVSYKTPEDLLNSDYIIDNKLSYYPNPVREELYLTWKNEPEKITFSIQVSNFNGQLIKEYLDLKTIEFTTISFQNYPVGVYNLKLNYVNGESKNLKIIKK